MKVKARHAGDKPIAANSQFAKKKEEETRNIKYTQITYQMLFI